MLVRHKFISRLSRAQEGGVAIYVAFISAILIGFGALVVDLGRLFTLQTELQAAADAAALAGAAELDRSADAITRARAAATTALVTAASPSGLRNRQTFASGGTDVTFDANADIRFLSSLPASDDDPITGANVTTDPANAHYIEVQATARQIDYLLAPVLAARIGGDGQGPTSGIATAVAVAGNNMVVCNFPPLMICNPSEANGNTGAAFEPVVGELIEIKTSGGGAQWGPGNFGLLDPPGGNQGAANVVENIARANPTGCYSSYVDTRTGSAQNPVAKGVNVRFDMYENPGFKNKNNDSDYRPASNVIKGKYKQGNKYEDYPAGSPPAGLAMPYHDCKDAGTCDTLGPSYHERFMPPADANLSAQETFWSDYWTVNHPGETFSSEFNTIDANGDDIVTRKEMYDWENSGSIPVGDTDGDGDTDSADASEASSSTGENGNPMIYSGSEAAEASRRIMPVAVVNCDADGPIQGNTDNVPVVAFAKMFLSHPAEDGSEQSIYAEMIGTLQPGIDDELHDIIQLYR